MKNVTSVFWDAEYETYKEVSHGPYATPIYNPNVESKISFNFKYISSYYGTPTRTTRLGNTATNAGVWMDNKLIGMIKKIIQSILLKKDIE